MSWLDDVLRRLDLVTVPPGEVITLSWDFVDDQHVVMPSRCSGDPAHEGIATEKKIPTRMGWADFLALASLPVFGDLLGPFVYSLLSRNRPRFNLRAPYCAECYRGRRRATVLLIIMIILLVLWSCASCEGLVMLQFDPAGVTALMYIAPLVWIALLGGVLFAYSIRARSQTIQRERAARRLGQTRNTRATLPPETPTAPTRPADTSSPNPLVNAIDDPDDHVRQAVIKSLIQFGDPGAVDPVELLVQNLHKPDVAIRLATVEVLGKLRSERAVEALVESMTTDEVPQVRMAAAKVLALAGTAAVSPLIAALGDPEADVRTRAAKSLEALEARQAVPALIERLDDPADKARRAAAGALGALNDPTAVDPLIRTLQDQSPDVRTAAARSPMALAPGRPLVRALHSLVLGETAGERAQAATTLGGLRDARAIPALRRAMDDQDQVCRNAAQALVRFGSTAALEPLVEALTGPTPGVRVTAAEALGELADNRAEGPLLQALQDQASEVRQSAAAALVAVSEPSFRPVAQTIRSLVTGQAGRRAAVARLGKLGDRRAAPPVKWALLHDEDVDVRVAAARALPRLDVAPIELLVQALGTSTSAKAVEVLVALGSDTMALLIEAVQATGGSAQQAAIDALGQIGNERAVESLIGALQSTGAQTREAAVQALGRLTADPRVVPALIQMLRDTALGVRDLAAQALGQSGDPRAVEPLVQALDNRRLRNAASEALRQLGDLATEALLARYQREKDKEVRRLIGDLLGDKKPPSLKDKLLGRKRK